MDYALQCKKGVLLTIRYNNVADELGALCAFALTPSDVAHKPLINYGWQWMVMLATAAELACEAK